MSIVLALILVTPLPVGAFNWNIIAANLKKSTFSLQTLNGDVYCSGWVIDNKRDFGMTADHCVHSAWATKGLIIVDSFQAFEVEGSESLDYAVLYIQGIDRPELKPRFNPLEVGQEVGAYGWARESGLYSHFRVGVIAAVNAPVDGLKGRWTIFDQPGIGGMSGGPIVDINGQVVSMTQRSDRRLIGLGRSIGEIWRATRKYWK